MEQNEVEKVAAKYILDNFEIRHISLKDVSEAFKAGAEWQKEQNKMFSMGDCQRCKQEIATKDYNGHSYYVCNHCFNRLNDEFDEEYK